MTQLCELLFKLQFMEAMINKNKVVLMKLKELGSWAGFRLGDFLATRRCYGCLITDNSDAER